MSRSNIACLLVAAFALTICISCAAQAPKVIAEKLYDQMNQAEADHDLNRLLGFVDSSYVWTDQHRTSKSYAEWRRVVEHNYTLLRNAQASTTVKDAQLVAGRMVVYYKTEMHYEWHAQPGEYGWVPQILKASAEDTWERNGDQWKLVRRTTYSASNEVDPEWVKEKLAELELRSRIAERAGQIPGSRYPH